METATKKKRINPVILKTKVDVQGTLLIKLAQANLAELYEELSSMIPREKRTKNKEEKAKLHQKLKAKVIG